MSNPNGVANITEKILAEARAFAEEQAAAARAEADATTAECERQAGEAYSAAVAAAKEQAGQIAKRTEGQAEMDRRRMLLATRQACVQKAFDLALDKLKAMPEEKRAGIMARMGARYQSADGEYIFNASDREALGGKVVAEVSAALNRAGKPFKAAISQETGSFVGGFILRQGGMEVNCTFEVLTGGVREELEGEASSILFS
ncbi:MAG: hypothetical protein LBU86_05325 [Oscillospiraceae bacterium]|nr:hypothetical protein [Oscillospiraceae bacterium]